MFVNSSSTVHISVDLNLQGSPKNSFRVSTATTILREKAHTMPMSSFLPAVVFHGSPNPIPQYPTCTLLYLMDEFVHLGRLVRMSLR